MASFGPTNDAAAFPPAPIIAPLLRPADVSACHTPGRIKASVEDMSEGGKSKPLPGSSVVGDQENKDSADKDNSWFSWVSGKAKKSREKSRRVSSSQAPYEGSVVIADRGSCMFEQKAIFSENGGAVALIVVNSEVSVFLLLHVDWNLMRSSLCSQIYS